MRIPPPRTTQELMNRAYTLAGKTLAEIAYSLNETPPPHLQRAKGWIGQLIEKALGANAFNLDQPDFLELGIELKTLPVSCEGQVLESTYICTAPIPPIETNFTESRVWRKMANMLWIPIETDNNISIAERRIGTPLLWQPSTEIFTILQQDWEELTELLTLGRFEELSAHKGQYLQIRPKAANSKTFIQVVNHLGQTASTVPKGFYLRACLTQQILNANYLIA